MSSSLQSSLSKLVGSSVIVSPGTSSFSPELGQASATFLFNDGTKLEAEFWRLIEDGRASYSSFDHQQKYGLPAPIDAIQELQARLDRRAVTEAMHDCETGDLLFKFNQDTKLQILNFTGYEIWELRFSDGTCEYSNYAK